MQLRHLNSTTPLICLGLTLAIACQSDKGNKDDTNLPPKPINEQAVESSTSPLPRLDVTTEITGSGLLLRIANIPDGSVLECDLNDQAINPCHNGALITTPNLGDHKVKATALRAGEIVAIGESAPFTISAEHLPQINPDDSDPLRLSLTNADFVTGTALSVNQEYKFQFALPQPESCQAELYCRYGGNSADFWSKCNDQNNRQFVVDVGLMAMGRQSLTVQARCSDKIGPSLELTWYGVSDDYQALTLSSVADPQGKTFVYLMKSDDCPASQLSFECNEHTEGNDWALCPLNNVLEKPASGSRVRASCDGRKGPPLVL